MSDPDFSPHPWGAAIDQLFRIRRSPEDWEWEGSESPGPDLVDAAIRLASWLMAGDYPPPDHVVTGVNGTVYFEWRTPAEYQEIEITSPSTGEWRRVTKGSNQANGFDFVIPPR